MTPDAHLRGSTAGDFVGDREVCTRYIPFCNTCPAVWTWPARSLIEGCCPKCGKDHPQAWRFAAARRILLRREREAQDG